MTLLSLVPAAPHPATTARAGRRLADLRFRWSVPVVLTTCGAVFGWLLFAVRHLDFYYDEWDFIDRQQNWRLRDYFVPHVEHWSTVPMLIYKAEVATVGTGSYVWYSASVLVLHCAIAFLLFTLVRRTCGDVLGISAAALMLVLGSGADDVIWAFQVGYTGSIVGGLLALLAVDTADLSRRRAGGAVLALLYALGSSGVGLYFLVAVTLRIALHWQWRRRIVVVAIPALAYGIWYLEFGRAGLAAADKAPFSLHAVSSAATYLPTGIGAAAVGMFAPATSSIDLVGFLAVCTVLGLLIWRRGLDSAPAAVAGAALFTQFFLMSLVRAQFGTGQARSPRYRYVAVVFLLIILTEAAREAPWRQTARVLLPVLVFVACVANTRAMVRAVDDRTALLAVQKDEQRVVWFLHDAPGLRRDAVFDTLRAPSLLVGDYLGVRGRSGSGLAPIDRAGLDRLPAATVNSVLAEVVPIRIDAGTTAADSTLTECTTTPPGGTADVRLDDGARLLVRAPGPFRYWSWYLGQTPGDDPVPVHADSQPGPVLLTVPDSGHGLGRWLRIGAARDAGVTVCRAAPGSSGP